MKQKRKGWVLAEKRLLIFCLIVVMTAAPVVSPFLTVEAATIENPWDGVTLTKPEIDQDGTYLIRTGAELAWFAAEVNGGRGEINARLENYIYLNSYNTSYLWTPIGATLENPYRGTFDGNGKKIAYMRTEINTDDPEYRYAGLFGVVDGGSIRNVTITGKLFQNYGNYGGEGGYEELYVGSGAIAGYLKNGQISGCDSYVRTTMDTGGEALYRNSGGIVGICSGMVINCTNYGKLSTNILMAQNHVGGIAGLVYGINAQVVNCCNEATVIGYFCVGGIAGAVKSGGSIEACANYGTVKGNSIFGGIAGRISTSGVYSNGNAKQSMIRNVYNLGTIGSWGTTAVLNEAGGIVGEMGYENWKQEYLPPMPVIEQAYSIDNWKDRGVSDSRSGAVIGYALSGAYGTVYGKEGSGMQVVGATHKDKRITILGEARMLTGEECKSAAMITKLGSAFTMSGKHDTLNDGYPKLVWQGLPSELLEKIGTAQCELNGWLTEAKQRKYGKNYANIESIVKTYSEKINSITTEEALDSCMAAARKELDAVKPGLDADNELIKAIDNGIIALEEYEKKLLSEHPDLTDNEKTEMAQLLSEWTKTLERTETIDKIRLVIRDAKDAMDVRVASYEENKRIEEIRETLMEEVRSYRSEETFDTLWAFQISQVKEKALAEMEKASTVEVLKKLTEQAKTDVDAVISKIPEEGAWDGETRTEPSVNDDGVYQITRGSELAWFAEQVNTSEGTYTGSAELCTDISLGFANWVSIGKDPDHVFGGSFYGNGYMIRGLSIGDADEYVGLFGIVSGAGQRIEDLTVSGSIQVSVKTFHAGGIAAYAKDGYTLSGCHNKTSVKVEEIRNLDGGVGGVVGRASGVTLRECSNEASVSVPTASKGGITYYAGGLVGRADPGTVVTDSFNSGTVWCKEAAGGLVGAVRSGGVTIVSSYNAGDITGKTASGGLLGASYESGNTISWCYSSGTVNLNDSGRASGALFGQIKSSEEGVLYALKRTDSLQLALAGVSGDYSATGRFLSDNELKSDDIRNALNGGGDSFIRDYLEIQGGYPILKWQMTLEDMRTGAIREIQNYVKEEDYDTEHWSQVTALIQNGTERILQAEDMPGIAAVLTEVKEAIRAVETRAETNLRKLQEAQDQAVEILENYVDLTVYREEEQDQITSLVRDAKQRILLAETVEEVQKQLDETRSRIDRIPNAWQYENEMNAQAAAQVDAYILNIGDVIFTPYVKLSIDIARLAYDGLTEKQKSMVTVYQTLLDAEAEWSRLEELHAVTAEDLELAEEVEKLIDAIGTVTEDSREAIEKARYAYDSLTEKQQIIVENARTLSEAELTYNHLLADPVEQLIASIGTVTLEKKDLIDQARDAYDALTEEQKALVKDYQVLKDAVTTYWNLVAAQTAVDLIDQIGEVTLESGPKIRAAIEAYNSLTGEQQELVKNYDVLEHAAAAFDSLQAIDNVVRLIDAIGAVSSKSGEQITAARAAYEALAWEQQKQVGNYSVLQNAEHAYEALVNPPAIPEPGTGQENQQEQPVQSSWNGGQPGSVPVSASGNGQERAEAASVSESGTVPETEAERELHQEDGYDGASETEEAIPDWLKEELERNGITENGDPTKPVVPGDKRKVLLVILGIVFAACGLLTGAFGTAIHLSSVKRKKKKLYY